MNAKLIFFSVMMFCTQVNIMYVLLLATLSIHPHQASWKNRLYRYVMRTNVSFFDPSPNDQRTEHSCA